MAHTTEDYIALEQEERELTDEALLAMFLILAHIKGDIETELRKFYSKYGKDGVVTYAEARKWISEQNHQRRLTALTIVITGAFGYLLNDLEKHFTSFLTGVIAKESTFFGVKIDVDKLLTRPWGMDDLYWLQRLEADVNLWNKTILRDLKQALHKGAHLDDIIAQLEKRFGSIEKVLNKLGLSESTAVGSLSRQEVFKALGIAKYRFYAKEDERTCEQCGALHGTVFPISAFEVGVTASPIHPHCRCWEVPITE